MSSLSCLQWWDLETGNNMTIRDRWLFITWGRILGGGDHLILGEQKGGSVVTENPAEEGDHWKLWKDSEGGTTQICLENEESR